MASKSTQRVTGAHELRVGMTLVGHEPSFAYTSDGERRENLRGPTISYFPGGKRMVSGSGDKTARVWDLRTGNEIEEARVVCEQEVCAVVASGDDRWVIAAGGDHNGPLAGELKVCEVKKGIVKTLKGHSQEIRCIDISTDNKLLASGSWDHTTRIWSLDTGKLVAGPFESVEVVGAVRFSQDSRKLAVQSWINLEVWDIEGQKLDVKVGEYIFVSNVPVFWTTKDQTIVAAFGFTDDAAVSTIYEFQASTLDIVGAPFKKHTKQITSLALSSDCALLASSSYDTTIKLWAFESRQLLASFNVQYYPRSIIISPDARQIAYTTFGHSIPKIYICNTPPDILANIWPSINAPQNTHISDPLDSSATTRPAAVHRNPATASFATQPLRYPPTIHQQPLSVLRHLHKLLPSSFRMDAVPLALTDEPRDPLDYPATSPRLSSHLSPAPATTVVHSNPSENSRPTPALPISHPSASTTIISRLRHFRSSNWWPIHTNHALPHIVSVPLAQGKERNAAAGAPKGDGGYRPDEDFDSPPHSPNHNSQQPSTSVQTTAGEHGNGRLCFCL